MPAEPIYNSATWRKVRKLILERDGFVCQLRGPGCTIKATDVDHVVACRDGGAWYDPSNLRAACRQCNSRRARREVKRNPSREW